MCVCAHVCVLMCACVCRFLGLMAVFVGGALLSFLLTIVVLRRREKAPQLHDKGKYELVNGNQKTTAKDSSEEKELKT